ncbi:urease accessory protein UreE, partial [Synechococcus sp. GFB01]
LRLPLTADQRTSLRGHRRSACGRDLVLQLPRGAALEPGDLLLPESGCGEPAVRVEAAPEAVLRVRSADPLGLLQAAYHLGNRHVAMEIHADRLILPDDSVLADLLRRRGLEVERLQAPFRPEPGAYEGQFHRHGHPHGHHDTHGHHHGHSHSQPHGDAP